ncbi:hypothetical protein [Enterobacter cloacae]|uniref:hypothetical protein n=1 Tax=Enterobacter cloacae TaxID=550 RepID=UPI002FFA7579
MQELTGKPLHNSQFGGVRIVCTPALTADLENHFKSNGLDACYSTCFSNNATDKLNVIFEVVSQSKKLAGAIMGLLNRNDVEIELQLCTRDEVPQTAKVKLRSLKDLDACERLIDKLAAVVVTPKQDEK